MIFFFVEMSVSPSKRKHEKKEEEEHKKLKQEDFEYYQIIYIGESGSFVDATFIPKESFTADPTVFEEIGDFLGLHYGEFKTYSLYDAQEAELVRVFTMKHKCVTLFQCDE